jgi:hypothetical protein
MAAVARTFRVLRPVARENDRRTFIGGSDARIIMGDDEAALVRLWREKRGEVEPEDLADIVQQTVTPIGARRCGCATGII